MNPQLENNFSYHTPTPEQVEKYEAMRNAAKKLGYIIKDLCPDSREQSLALTNLEQTLMWANAAIARN